MTRDIRILRVEKDGDDGLVVAFSDGTTAGYLAQELLELRPYRQTLSETPKIHDLPQMPVFSS
jgi:hypothetical protein